jgi:hypothetical protein
MAKQERDEMRAFEALLTCPMTVHHPPILSPFAGLARCAKVPFSAAPMPRRSLSVRQRAVKCRPWQPPLWQKDKERDDRVRFASLATAPPLVMWCGQCLRWSELYKARSRRQRLANRQ